jgi:carboxyl-terminal processing protease
MRYKIIIVLCSFFLFVSAVVAEDNTGSSDDHYYKINKSFDLFGAVFKQITNNYVIEIDPEELVLDGINGMLESLDPYTTYLDEYESEDIDLLTHGSYVGLGITVSNIDSMLTIVRVRDGFSANRNGLRPGDRIYKVDGDLLLYSNTDDLRKYTRGKPGSTLEMTYIRDGINDTVTVDLPREEIIVDNISYYGMLSDSIGYIKLERFSRFSAKEMKDAINEMKRDNPLTGIVLDLRDNPGGLLEAAVSVCELFVDDSSAIVTTKSRFSVGEKVYKSKNKPVAADLDLAVLINNNSASASEIVAGAVQDLDKGIILGERSFGKGLVQSVFNLPYNSSLKMTTSRYFTPSGRSIHSIKYDPKRRNFNKADFPDDSSHVFYTKNGRPVFESKGITPDSIISDRPYSEYVSQLYFKNHFFNFATIYSSRLNNLPENFVVNDKILHQFKKYIEAKEFEYESKLTIEVKILEEAAKEEGLGDNVLEQIEKLSTEINNFSKDAFDKHKDDISRVLYMEIASRFFTEKQMVAESIKKDTLLTTAMDLLQPYSYDLLLTNTKKSSDKH